VRHRRGPGVERCVTSAGVFVWKILFNAITILAVDLDYQTLITGLMALGGADWTVWGIRQQIKQV
jgi:hypothetical protein